MNERQNRQVAERPAKKTHLVTLKLDDMELAELRALARREGQTVSGLLRALVEQAASLAKCAAASCDGEGA